MKTFTIAITTMCLIAGTLFATSTAGAARSVGPQPVPALSQPVTTPGGTTFRTTKLRGGNVLLKRFGDDATRVSVVIDPKGSKVTYNWAWIGPFLDWIINKPAPKDEGTTPCMRSKTTVKTKDGTVVTTTQESGNCPKQ